MKLQEPSKYMPMLARLRARNPYARSWPLRLERKTNRHPDTWNRSWGWYEVWPLGIEVGFWGHDRDDLAGVDLPAWNEEAARVSQEAANA